MDQNQQKTRWKILLVDDDEDYYFLIQDMLSRSTEVEFEMDWVSSVEQALQKACKGDYDVSLVDYRLGGESGLDLLVQFEAACPDEPVILITAWPKSDIINASQRFGADSFLDKSNLNTQILVQTIRKVLSARKI